MKVKSLIRVRLFATPQTAAYQAPPSMGFSRQEYWSGFPLPSLARQVRERQMEPIAWKVREPPIDTRLSVRFSC